MSLFGYLRTQKKSDGRPYSMGGAVGVFIFAILLVFAFSATDAYLLGRGGLAAVVSATLVDLANGDRSSYDVPTLTVNPLLVAVAQAKADDMAAKGYFAHTSPDGKDPWYWYAKEGYSFLYAGENLAVDFNDSGTVNSAWMNSPEHRANLLNARFTQIGIATAEGSFEGHPTTFVVEEFGTPAAAKTATVPAQTVEPSVATEPALASAKPAATPARESAATSAPVLGASAQHPAPSGTLAARAIASPASTLRYAYYLLAALILLVLAYVTRVEFRRHHLHHVAAASVLLVFMAALLLVADLFIFTQPVLAAIGG